MATGYIYILSNASMQGMLKIGFTCSSVEKRARELSSVSGVPSPFVIEYFHLSDDVEEVEDLIHSALGHARVADGREFFFISVTEAIGVIGPLIRKATVSFQREPAPAEISVATSCRRCGFSFERTADAPYCPKCGY